MVVESDYDDHDKTSVYTNAAGDELTFAQIAMAAAKEPDIEVTEPPDGDGYLFDGDPYTPVERAENEDGG